MGRTQSARADHAQTYSIAAHLRNSNAWVLLGSIAAADRPIDRATPRQWHLRHGAKVFLGKHTFRARSWKHASLTAGKAKDRNQAGPSPSWTTSSQRNTCWRISSAGCDGFLERAISLRSSATRYHSTTGIFSSRFITGHRQKAPTEKDHHGVQPTIDNSDALTKDHHIGRMDSGTSKGGATPTSCHAASQRLDNTYGRTRSGK